MSATPIGLTVLSLGRFLIITHLTSYNSFFVYWVLIRYRDVCTIDGGGVRGYSSLLILRAVMLEIKRVNNLPTIPKPCDYFDLVAGTSTGGFVHPH